RIATGRRVAAVSVDPARTHAARAERAPEVGLLRLEVDRDLAAGAQHLDPHQLVQRGAAHAPEAGEDDRARAVDGMAGGGRGRDVVRAEVERMLGREDARRRRDAQGERAEPPLAGAQLDAQTAVADLVEQLLQEDVAPEAARVWPLDHDRVEA